MNTKYLSIYPQWHCRNRGGLFLGIRLQFPNIIYDIEAVDRHTSTCLRLTLGLLVFSINVEIKYNYAKDIPWPKPLDPPTSTAEAEARQKKFEDGIRHIQG